MMMMFFFPFSESEVVGDDTAECDTAEEGLEFEDEEEFHYESECEDGTEDRGRP